MQFATTVQVRPGEGVATIKVPIPHDLDSVGTSFYAQWLVRGASGRWRTTRVLEIEVQAEPLRRTL